MKTALMALMLAGAAGTASAATYTFQHGVGGYAGTSDVTLFSSYPDSSNGYDEEVSIDASDSGSPNHVLLRFDDLFGAGAGQIKSTDTIVSATLTLEITSAGSGIQFHDMLVDWKAHSATWNSLGDGIQADGSEASAQPFLVLGANDGNPNIDAGPLVLDFTETLRRIQNGSAPGYGWALLPFMPDGTNGVDFYTSDYYDVDYRPLLTVEVAAAVPEPETYAMLLAGLGLVGALARRRG
jgi:hypothetical protein